ncbi:hypothetical protein [Sporomusa ovata]|uniref:hypothetical protein n=1 Tax=Sporomusa ovata TaxID=2378 RepID=UPI001B7F89C5|nr:hypothetical protein [Sporomusa ovata]
MKFSLDTGCCIVAQGISMGLIRPHYAPEPDRKGNISIPELDKGTFGSTIAEQFFLEDLNIGSPEGWRVY